MLSIETHLKFHRARIWYAIIQRGPREIYLLIDRLKIFDFAPTFDIVIIFSRGLISKKRKSSYHTFDTS